MTVPAKRFGSVLLGLALCAAGGLAAGDAAANMYVGDVVYCDVGGEKGTFDPADGDYPIDGVDVRVVCTDSAGAVCADHTTTTGTVHPTVNPVGFANETFGCGLFATWDILDPADHAGRYVVEVLGSGCLGHIPFECEVVVDESTLPDDCSELVTPTFIDIPIDGNADGDWCDAEDGPFVEGQILGDNGQDPALCEASASPGPDDGVHVTRHAIRESNCSLYADFGYMPPELQTGPTRTPGYWKRHPVAVEANLPVEFCGETITEVCDAVDLLSTGGGGIRQFTRHAVAAALNCNAFGCPAQIAELLAEGNAACEAGDDYEFGAAGDALDIFNNSGTEIDDDLNAGPADPRFCR